MNIRIKPSECITCGKCAKVCPSLILTQKSPTAAIEVNHPDSCIACGHCVAVCPSSAIDHEIFPASSISPVDYTLYPTPEQMMTIIRARRSNRAFTRKLIPKESLLWMKEAGLRAPTASNSLNMDVIVIDDPEKLKVISTFTIEVFDKLARLLTNPLLKPILKRVMPDVYKYEKAFGRMKEEYAQGNDMILRGATAVLLFYTPKKSRFGAEDCNLAYQNASLMAESMGVSQFYTGFVLNAVRQDKKDTLAKALGFEGTIYAGMALGMPQFKYPNYMDRRTY